MLRTHCMAAFAVGLLAAAPAAAEPRTALTTEAGLFEAGFEVFIGGLRIARLNTETAIDADRYRQAIHFETAGVLAWFVDGQSTAVSEGGFDDDGAIRAERVSVEGLWNEEPRSYAIRFGPNGRLRDARFDPPIDVSKREPVPDALRVGPDPLSVVVAAALSLPDNAHNRSVTAYDGKRAMRFGWTCGEATEQIETDVYAGPVIRCEIEGEQIGGFHHEYGRNNIQAPRPAKAWLAPVDDGRFYAPVKLLMETQYGGLVANMIRLGPPTRRRFSERHPRSE